MPKAKGTYSYSSYPISRAIERIERQKDIMEIEQKDQMEAKAMSAQRYVSWRSLMPNSDVVLYVYKYVHSHGHSKADMYGITVRGDLNDTLPDELRKWCVIGSYGDEDEVMRDFAAIYLHFLMSLGEPTYQKDNLNTTTDTVSP